MLRRISLLDRKLGTLERRKACGGAKSGLIDGIRAHVVQYTLHRSIDKPINHHLERSPSVVVVVVAVQRQ